MIKKIYGLTNMTCFTLNNTDMKTVNLEEILFAEIDKLRKDIPNTNLYSNEEVKNSEEYKYLISAMKEACKQTLKLAAENSKVIFDNYDDFLNGKETYITDKDSILDTINQVK